MKKILIISYYYSPANFVGAERIDSFAKHLHKFGVYPIIVTRNWNPNQTNTYEKIHENGFKHNVYDTHEEYYMPYEQSWRDKLFGKTCFFCTLLRRILTVIELFVSTFWLPALPYVNLYTQARKLLKEQKDIEALIISGSPFESFHFGYKLKQEFSHIHWIPDYRDEWTAFSRYPLRGIFEKAIFNLNSYLEKIYTSNASCFISVSDYWVQRIAFHIDKKGYTIRNGFEPKLAEASEFKLDNSKFVLAYVGSVYPYQDFDPILNVLSKLAKNFKDQITVELNFYGTQDDAYIRALILQHTGSLNLKCNIFPRVSSDELHEKLLYADIFYATKYGDLDGFIPVKVFDYYNLSKPILHFPSDKGDIENFILSTHSGWAIDDENDCYYTLSEFVEKKINRKVLFKSNERKDASFYTREHQASVLAMTLDQIMASGTYIAANHLKKILILAYDFPPYVSVGGLRPYNWFKHFKEFELYPIIITRQWSNKYGSQIDFINKSDSESTICEVSDQGTIYRTSYTPNWANKILLKYGDKRFSLLRKFITMFYEVMQFLFLVGSKKELYIEADRFLKNNRVDLILVTGEPFVLFHYANKLGKKYNLPWAGDYRDPWVLGTSDYSPALLKFWFAYHEKRLIKKMSFAVTVSEFMKKKIQDFSEVNMPVYVAANGYDGESIEPIKTIIPQNKHLTLCYAGWIYPYHPYRDLFKVLCDLTIEDPDFKFALNFYGINLQSKLENTLNTDYSAIRESIVFYPKLPNSELLLKLANGDVMVLFNEYSFMGTKIYDYLGVKRFILHFFTDDTNALDLKRQYFPMTDEKNISDKLQEEAILYTASGVSLKDKEELKKELKRLSEKFKKEGRIAIDSENTEFYSRKNQTRILSEIVKKMVHSNLN